MDVSVCLVTHNQGELLRDCLDSLREATSQIAYEVIVTDLGSEDGTVEMLETDYPEARVIRLRHNPGFATAMNLALRSGEGDYLFMLNPASVVHTDLLENLLAFIDVYPEAGICSPRVLTRAGSLYRDCRRSAGRYEEVLAQMSGLARLFPRDERLARYYLTFLPENDICEVEAVSSVAMLIRRETAEAIGWLDEAFKAADEDRDYCMRARQAGWEVYYVPSASLACAQSPMAEIGTCVADEERYYARHIEAMYPAWANAAMRRVLRWHRRLTLPASKITDR